MLLTRFEPREYEFKIHRGVHYAMEADGISDKNNECMLTL